MFTLRLQSISFSFPNSHRHVIHELSTTFSPGWTSLVGANGCGKSTLLKIMAKQLAPSSGHLQSNYLTHLCEQDTQHPPANLDHFLEAFDGEALRIKTHLSLHELITRKWQALSSGEQKRFQLGCALWSAPEVLLVDEPTNHLDARNRNFIIEALKHFRGIGIVVSHDREVLEALCSKHLFFVGSKVIEGTGSFHEAKTQLEQNFATKDAEKAVLKQQNQRLKSEATRLHTLNQSAKKRLSKIHVDAKDHDTKAKMNLAKLTGKDASLGQKQTNIQNRVAHLEKKIDSFDVIKDYTGAISFAPSETSRSKVVLFQEAGSISLPDGTALHFPELTLRTSEKIGIIGRNGVGKSSLLANILEAGWLKTTRYFYLPQELDTQNVKKIRTQLIELSSEDLARCLQIIARLGSDPKAIMASQHWSHGEVRKVAIALAIVNGIEMLLLDEPTNHLDLPSLENMEQALSKSLLTLLIVSHDTAFLQHVCSRFWKLLRIGENTQLEEATIVF
jgi:macrolide transport system ATP-binding/permease protein